jgi:hypothetical protein
MSETRTGFSEVRKNPEYFKGHCNMTPLEKAMQRREDFHYESIPF